MYSLYRSSIRRGVHLAEGTRITNDVDKILLRPGLHCYYEGWDGERVGADYCERGFGEDWGMDERAGWTTMSSYNTLILE